MAEEKEKQHPAKIQKRIEVFDLLEAKQIAPKEAARQLKITVRQIRRVAKRYKAEGVSGLYSKKIGQVGNNKLADELKEHFTQLVRENYPDFGPTFAHEKLTELHDAQFSIETLRKWMIESRIWTPHLKPKQRQHPLRERRSCVGELIQIDGSKHLWFEDRGGYTVLLVAIDDATSTILSARFVAVENAENYLRMFKDYFKEHGLPVSLYSDKHGIFKVNAKNCEDNETQFKRIVDALGIGLIHAHSPQAKGRVERVFQTLQDRLVKEFRLAGIDTIEGANAFLINYLPKHNERFGVLPASGIDKHIPLTLSEQALDKALAFKHKRQVRSDYSISYNSERFDLYTHNPMPYLKGQYVDVLELLDDELIIQFQGKEVYIKRREVKPVPTSASAKTINATVDAILQKPPRTIIPMNMVTSSQQQAFAFSQLPAI